MKKILTFVLALSMAVSMFVVNVNAAVNASFVVSYEDADGNAVAGTALKADSLLFVKIVMNDVETLKIVDTKLTWNPDVVKVIDNKGADATADSKIAAYTTKRASKTILDEYEETFLSETPALYPVEGRAELTSYTTDTATLYEADGNIVAIYRFKVIKNGNAGFGLVAKVNEGEGLEEVSQDKTEVPALTIGAAAAPQSFNAKVPYGAKAQAAEGIKFNLTTNDTTKTVKTVDYSVPFFKTEDDKSKIENIGNIAVGLTINGVPSGVTVTANSAELY